MVDLKGSTGDAGNAGRGPAYPFIDLQKAVQRAYEIAARGAERTSLLPKCVYGHWAYSPKSSGARSTMAAMRAYGLLEYVGRGPDRKVRLTYCARRIVLDHRTASTDRASALEQAALSPPVFAELWDHFGPNPPSSEVMISWLVLEADFNETGAAAAVANFLASIEYARLNENYEARPATDHADDGERPQVGDLVELEVNGEPLFEDPVRVRAVPEDGDWVFVEGSEAGISLENVAIVERGEGAGSPDDPVIEPPAPPGRGDTGLRIVLDRHSIVIRGRTQDIAAVDQLLEDLRELRPILARRWAGGDGSEQTNAPNAGRQS